MALILKSAEGLMLKQGYAAVTVRSVAKIAGVSSTLLHYYFPTIDDLLVALYRHSTAKDFELLERALAADEPLAALWAYQTDSKRTSLAVEYLALANHRKAIKSEIAKFAGLARKMQTEKIAEALATAGVDPAYCSPLCISMLLTSVSRNLIIEEGVGLNLGHADARAYVERQLTQLIGPRADAKS
jgi:AcrR family transcriptional regulator